MTADVSGIEGSLTDDLLTRVLEYTGPKLRATARAVNKRWRNVASCYRLWRSIRLSRVDDNRVNRFAHAPYLKTLKSASFGKCFLSDIGMQTLAACCPQIVNINFRELLHATDDGIITFIHALPRLQSFKLRSEHITNRSVTELILKCPLLETLELAQCPSLTSLALASLATHPAPSLRAVNLSFCNMDDLSVEYLTKCPALKVLNLSATMLTPFGTAILADSLHFWPKLDTLFINCLPVENISQHITLHGQQVRQLSLAFTTTLESYDVVQLASHRLKSLIISGSHISDSALQQLTVNCPNLETLHLDCCSNVSDAGVIHLASLRLRSLVLDCCSVTDASIVPVVTASQAWLCNLSLNDCAITDLTANAICNCRNLASLTLSGCKGISLQALGQIINTSFHTLRILDVTSCAKKNFMEIPSCVKVKW